MRLRSGIPVRVGHHPGGTTLRSSRLQVSSRSAVRTGTESCANLFKIDGMSGRILVDAAIAGGGIIGLSLGLELRRRGVSVVVIERQQAMSSASWAAGGMLAVMDPQNPPELMPLAVRSREMYPEYLWRIEELSGKAVPVRTER